MIYKLKKEMSNHDIGDILYLVDIKGDSFYEWLDERDYILPKKLVECDDTFFEKIETGYNIGDKIYYLNHFGEIVENLFDCRTHVNLLLVGNLFGDRRSVIKFKNNIIDLIKNKK
jgi:hypothetical protein